MKKVSAWDNFKQLAFAAGFELQDGAVAFTRIAYRILVVFTILTLTAPKVGLFGGFCVMIFLIFLVCDVMGIVGLIKRYIKQVHKRI